MKLIIGLGNPGKEYENTRHNIGFKVIDTYLGNIKYKSKFDGLYYEYNDKEKVIFLKPQTYMNNSGISVKKFVDFYKFKLEDIMVIQDDLDIDIGKFKFKFNSSSGGHNGIKSIINNLNSKEFFRMKIGIRTNNINDTIDFVLGKFSNKELESINYELLLSAIDDFIKYDYKYVMNKYNGMWYYV